MRASFRRFVAPSLLVLMTGGVLQKAPAQSSPSEKVVGGPYVVNVGPRSATVMWVIQAGEASLSTEPDKTVKSAPVLQARKTTFLDLKRGTTYYYQAFPGEAGKGSFKTPPDGEA